MIKRYIKINSNSEITDIFTENLKDKLDGSEIYLDDVDNYGNVWINGKCIFDTFGNPLFKYVNKTVVEIDPVKYIQQYRDIKIHEIKEAFKKEFIDGHYFSDVLKIEVDSRRYNEKDDLQNVQGMITNYESLTEAMKYYVGYVETTTFPLSLDQLKALEKEMIAHGTSLFIKKRTLMAQINGATTITAVLAISW